ncbi:hypothetical protein PIB30_038558 [Stylosanthes scabra]|uniref:Ubiquitin-like protease family profile domain-containing protein n=1 Tax=Stylosanthes scabra TaxID=79078 RepID=A0ABU6YBE4_9FABA|nr:hypothetical protein [Stylosanthes scabra]
MDGGLRRKSDSPCDKGKKIAYDSVMTHGFHMKGQSGEGFLRIGDNVAKGLRLFGSLMNSAEAPTPRRNPPMPQCQSTTSSQGQETLFDIQAWAANYAFHPDSDPREELGRFGNCSLQRRHLMSLLPGEMLSGQIVEAFAARLTFASERPIGLKFWCLPPSFAEDVHGQIALDHFLGIYRDFWMKPSKLKYVYLPVMEYSGHWFMGVIGFMEHAIFYLDNSNSRRHFKKALAERHF